MPINRSDLEAIKQAITAAIDSAGGVTAGTTSATPNESEIARLEAYLDALNRADTALGKQETRARRISEATARQNELDNIAIERRRNLIEVTEATIQVNERRGTSTAEATEALNELIESEEEEIKKLQEKVAARSASVASIREEESAYNSIKASVQRLT